MSALLEQGSQESSACSAGSAASTHPGPGSSWTEERLTEQEEIILVAQDDPYMASLPEAETLPKQSESFSNPSGLHLNPEPSTLNP